MKRIYVLLIVTILLTGCATSSSSLTPTLLPTAELPETLPTAETPEALLEPTDPTQLIMVKTGKTFDLVVPSNPSTGYHWDIIPELDVNIVEFAGQSYVPEQPVMPGSSGVDVWSFRAVNAGDTTIVLGYYAPGNATDPEENVTFSIHVE